MATIDGEIEYWITINGNHIPIRKGQSREEAVDEFLKGKEDPRSYSVKELKEKQRILLDDIPLVEYAYGFANKERKYTKDHVSHAKDMGFKNQDDYEREATRFFNSDEGELYYSKRRKRFYRYDGKKQRVVVSSKGIIHTFMERTRKDFKRTIREDDLIWIK